MAEDRSVLSRPAPGPARSISYGQDPDQVIDVYPAGGRHLPGSALVLVHGGYWRPEYDRAHLRPMAVALAEAGWPTYLIEYRRIPGDPESGLADVRAAIAATAADLGDRKPILIGHSAGGHLALLAATVAEPCVGAVVALAPVADLVAAADRDLDDGAARELLGQAPPNEYCPTRQPSPSVPVVIVHGDADDLVPLALSQGYARAHPSAQLIELAGVAHFALIDPQSPTWPAVQQAIESIDPASAPGMRS